VVWVVLARVACLCYKLLIGCKQISHCKVEWLFLAWPGSPEVPTGRQDAGLEPKYIQTVL
jgi:hypothetical protein